MEPFARLVEANRAYVESGSHRPLPVQPSRQQVVLTCMDSRIDTFAALGLDLGETHIIRSAGSRVTDDVLRSLTLSTHLLGTRTIVVIGHTDCGLHDPDRDLVERLTDRIGHPPSARDWCSFVDPRDAVATDCERLRTWPDRPTPFAVAGYVLDVTDGRLHEVSAPTYAPDPVD